MKGYNFFVEEKFRNMSCVLKAEFYAKNNMRNKECLNAFTEAKSVATSTIAKIGELINFENFVNPTLEEQILLDELIIRIIRYWRVNDRTKVSPLLQHMVTQLWNSITFGDIMEIYMPKELGGDRTLEIYLLATQVKSMMARIQDYNSSYFSPLTYFQVANWVNWMEHDYCIDALKKTKNILSWQDGDVFLELYHSVDSQPTFVHDHTGVHWDRTKFHCGLMYIMSMFRTSHHGKKGYYNTNAPIILKFVQETTKNLLEEFHPSPFTGAISYCLIKKIEEKNCDFTRYDDGEIICLFDTMRTLCDSVLYKLSLDSGRLLNRYQTSFNYNIRRIWSVTTTLLTYTDE
jgi:hypothetical protein